MKILFFASGTVRSNFSYRILALASSLRRLGHDVAIIAPKADKYNNFNPEPISEINGVRILQPFQFATKRPEINLLPYLFGALRMTIREKPDIVYIYKPTPVSIVGLLGKIFGSATVVTDFDDLGSEVMKIEGHPLHQRKLVEWSEFLAVRCADKIVAASRYLEAIYNNRCPSKPVYFMPNGVDGEWFATPPASAADKPRIIFMGSINRKSILEPLFETLPILIKEYPSLEAIIIGDGKYLGHFKEQATKTGIMDNITFYGWLSLAEARALMKEGDIGYSYMPAEKTVRAASNMKIPQYMSRGVVPFVSEVNESVHDPAFAAAIYSAKSNDGRALLEELRRAITDPQRAIKGMLARKFAEARFDWDILAQGFNEWIMPEKKSNKTKIYVVSTTVPDESGGGEIRPYNLIKQLAQSDVELEVFSIAQELQSRGPAEYQPESNVHYHIVPGRKQTRWHEVRAALFKRLPPFMDVFDSSGLGARFNQACNASLPDFVQVEQLAAWYCIRKYIPRLKEHGVKIVFDCHNVEFKNFEESLELFPFGKRILGRYFVPRLKGLEIAAAKTSDIVLACSARDAEFFRAYNANTCVIPNGVDTENFKPAAKVPETPTLIFMGGVGYPPNGDAVLFYLNEIHPLVKKEVPGVRLLGIGVTAEWLKVHGVEDGSVEPLGFVPDVRPYLQKAMVGICPVRYGSGTRIKILTYMAAGIPTVSTSKGAEGVPYRNHYGIEITDEAPQFAEATIALLKDLAHREEMAREARAFVSTHYDWNVIGKDLRKAYAL